MENALNEWLERAQAISAGELSIDPRGKKYIRIISTSYGSRSAFCFIEKSTGNVLKPAGWNGPAPQPRGNIYQIGKEGVGRWGALYLK